LAKISFGLSLQVRTNLNLGIPRRSLACEEGGDLAKRSRGRNWKSNPPVHYATFQSCTPLIRQLKKTARFTVHQQLTREKHANTNLWAKEHNTCTPTPRLGEAKLFHSRTLKVLGFGGGYEKKRRKCREIAEVGGYAGKRVQLWVQATGPVSCTSGMASCTFTVSTPGNSYGPDDGPKGRSQIK